MIRAQYLMKQKLNLPIVDLNVIESYQCGEQCRSGPESPEKLQ